MASVRWLLVCLSVAVLPLAACSSEPAGDGGSEATAEAAPVEPRKPAPDFKLPDLEGKQVSLAGLRGKTLVIDFWATWCPPCIYQIPVLNEVQEAFAEEGVVVLGVSVDAGGLEVVAPYAETNDIRYTVLLGDEALARRFGAPGFPALVIVAPDGTIDSLHVGLIERSDIEEALARIQRHSPAST